MEEAEKIGLKPCPYDSGFFSSRFRVIILMPWANGFRRWIFSAWRWEKEFVCLWPPIQKKNAEKMPKAIKGGYGNLILSYSYNHMQKEGLNGISVLLSVYKKLRI